MVLIMRDVDSSLTQGTDSSSSRSLPRAREVQVCSSSRILHSRVPCRENRTLRNDCRDYKRQKARDKAPMQRCLSQRANAVWLGLGGGTGSWRIRRWGVGGLLLHHDGIDGGHQPSDGATPIHLRLCRS